MKDVKNNLIMKPKLAIIGTGIAGMACGYFLHKFFDVFLFEKNNYVGGHSLTAEAIEDKKNIPIDMGFMVFNKKTYPNLTRLFNDLQVPYKKSNMSFSVQHLAHNIEYCGSSLNHLFGQRKNILKLRHWRMLLQINRFNNEAIQSLNSAKYDSFTLKEYVNEMGYGEDFLNLYIVPMSSAIWSTPPELMLNFPAKTLLRFFHNHGFLGMKTQHQWLTPDGGSREYVKRLIEPFSDRIKTEAAVKKIIPEGNQATVCFSDGNNQKFDKVILASHADQSLALVDSNEFEILRKFKYQKNTGILHTDSSLMPRNKLCWASWNYRIKLDSNRKLTPRTIYWMNNLQGVSDNIDYFVNINGEEEVNPDTIIKKVNFDHPLFDAAAVEAQSKLKELNQKSKTIYLCGSYFKYGFHEDALNSAIELCESILKKPLWN